MLFFSHFKHVSCQARLLLLVLAVLHEGKQGLGTGLAEYYNYVTLSVNHCEPKIYICRLMHYKYCIALLDNVVERDTSLILACTST